MSETNNNTQGQKPKISKWATASMYSAFIGLALILLLCLSYKLLFNASEFIFYIVAKILLGVGLILIIFGFVAGIIGLIGIKASKGKLKGMGFAISGIIISSIPIILFISVAYFFYMAVIYEKPYDDSNSKAIMAKVEKVCDFEFPEKIESLKAAEKIASGIDRAYTFIVRFTTDQNSFAEFRNSLSKTKNYFEKITDELLTEDGKSYRYGSRGSMWQKNAPEWFNAEIPKGKVYELYPIDKMFLYFICVELPDSNDVIVNIEGWYTHRRLKEAEKSFDRPLIDINESLPDKLKNSKDEQKQ